MADAKPTSAAAKGEPQIKAASPLKAMFPYIAIIICLIVCFFVFYGVFTNPSNFEGGAEAAEALKNWDGSGEKPDPTAGHPKNVWATMYKGGFVIPIGMTLHLILWVFGIERLITIFGIASGRGSIDVFVKKVRSLLTKGDIDAAVKECDRHRGSVGNVVKAGLRKYKEMQENTELEKDEKKLAIQKELEEATMLELPMLERNLPILATIASLGTLVGLIGTVLGMIKAFQALGQSGAPNAAELSVGISEALVNTALGITTSAVAVMAYNFFTTKIDGMTYSMDEAGYSIVQTFDIRN